MVSRSFHSYVGASSQSIRPGLLALLLIVESPRGRHAKGASLAASLLPAHSHGLLPKKKLQVCSCALALPGPGPLPPGACCERADCSVQVHYKYYLFEILRLSLSPGVPCARSKWVRSVARCRMRPVSPSIIRFLLYPPPVYSRRATR